MNGPHREMRLVLSFFGKSTLVMGTVTYKCGLAMLYCGPGVHREGEGKCGSEGGGAVP
jgi:hypothetical protein